MRLKSFFLDLLFPIQCLGCSREGDWLCDECFKKIRFYTGQTANLAAPFLEKIYIAGNYDDPLLAKAIKKFKYDFISALSRPLGRFLCLYWQGQQTLGIAGLKGAILIPLPLSKKRLRWRGFNQSALLADELGAAFGYEIQSGLTRKNREPQAGLDEKERLENIKDAFRWTGGDLKGRNVILIDDVVTTGATLNEARLVLKEAGAGKIYALVLAKG